MARRWVLKLRLRGTIAMLVEYRSTLRATPGNAAEIEKVDLRLSALKGRLRRFGWS